MKDPLFVLTPRQREVYHNFCDDTGNASGWVAVHENTCGDVLSMIHDLCVKIQKLEKLAETAKAWRTARDADRMGIRPGTWSDLVRASDKLDDALSELEESSG